MSMGSERLDGKEEALLTSRRGPTADAPAATAVPENQPEEGG